MLEKLLLAGAFTFSVYVFSGVELPVKLQFPLASQSGEALTQIENEKEVELIPSREENTDKAAPWKTLANSFVNQ